MLIYPEERSVVINPIMITDDKGEKTLRFFLTFTEDNSIHEWTFFKPQTIPEKTWHYGSYIIDQLKTITEWNFSYNTLDDKNFWTKYVLVKEGDNFKYLNKRQ